MSETQGVVLDLDGTVYAAGEAIPGAVLAIETLRSEGVQIRFATNTTRQPRSALVQRLRGFGIEAVADDLVTAPLAAVAWLRAQGVQSVALYLSEATHSEFQGFTLTEDSPDAVVVGDLGDAWTYERLNRAFQQLQAGARLVAIQRNRYWRTSKGLRLDAGPFVAALEYATGAEAVTVGKPTPAFFHAAVESLSLPVTQVAMVGDDVISDVEGAMTIGLRGILVKTGKFQPEDLQRGVRPDAVIDSIADLPGTLRGSG